MDLDWPLEMWIKEQMYQDHDTGAYVSRIRYFLR